MMRVKDLGEFGLIERLREALGLASDERLIVGIGDDAAVLRPGSPYAVATTDTMVAGIHFVADGVSWSDVGWKALAVNLSDIAAMGGTPAFALVTLQVPPDMLVAATDELYSGLRECAETYSVRIVGGDIVSSPVFAITVALYGEAAVAADGDAMLLRRTGARAGDAIAVTGALGGSAGGLLALLGDPRGGDQAPLVSRHMRPVPRLDVGRAALACGVRTGIDISDGLVQDLEHVCAASRVGAELRAADVPVDPNVVSQFADSALSMALSGGEDYELILVAPEDALKRVEDMLGARLYVIGQIVEGPGRVRVLDGRGTELAVRRGWDHLATVDG